MSLKKWWQGFRWNPHDRKGNAKCLVGRESDPKQSEVAGISNEVRDEALKAICESFDISTKQMYCLRSDDKLMTIYHDMNGPRNWDEFQFLRLALELEKQLETKMANPEFFAFLGGATVADVVRFLAARRDNP